MTQQPRARQGGGVVVFARAASRQLQPAVYVAGMRYALALSVMLAAAPAWGRGGGVEGLWLVANPLPQDARSASETIVNSPIDFAARCGIKVDAYPAKDFDGIAAGTFVVGAGPYINEIAAAADLRKIRRCVPAATLRRLMYYGD